MMIKLKTVNRFAAKVDPGVSSADCWLWRGAKDRGGYGHLKVNGHLARAHRFLYQLLVGPIPKGLTLDHLCRNRACVRPSHLEPVTLRVNLQRGVWPNAHKTHCLKGHPYDEQNTYSDSRGWRNCRACQQIANKQSYQRYLERKSNPTQE